MSNPDTIKTRLDDIRTSLRAIGSDAKDLARSLKSPIDETPLRHALESILGNVEICISENKIDPTLLPWIRDRIKGVL